MIEKDDVVLKEPLVNRIPWKLVFAGFCTVSSLIMIFSIFFTLENIINIESLVIILVLSVMSLFSSMLLFFGGNDSLQIAFYNFFKEKGGAVLFFLFPHDRTYTWQFHRVVPTKTLFQKRPGQDDSSWAEIKDKPWRARGTGLPAYFFREGVPIDIDPSEHRDINFGVLVNKGFVLSELRGKIDALRNFFEKLETLTKDPKTVILLVVLIIISIVIILITYNALNLLIQIAKLQGIDPTQYVFIFG